MKVKISSLQNDHYRDTLKVQTIFFENVTKFKSNLKVKLVQKYLEMGNVNVC
jgi:flagellar basal body rod protein FlgG